MGYRIITEEVECVSASRYVGLYYDRTKKNSVNFPRGCFLLDIQSGKYSVIYWCTLEQPTPIRRSGRKQHSSTTRMEVTYSKTVINSYAFSTFTTTPVSGWHEESGTFCRRHNNKLRRIINPLTKRTRVMCNHISKLVVDTYIQKWFSVEVKMKSIYNNINEEMIPPFCNEVWRCFLYCALIIYFDRKKKETVFMILKSRLLCVWEIILKISGWCCCSTGFLNTDHFCLCQSFRILVSESKPCPLQLYTLLVKKNDLILKKL